MSVTTGVAARCVLSNEPLITIPGQTPKEHPVTHAALAVERQLHAVRIGDYIAVVPRTAMAWIFSEISMSFKIICTPVIPILELVRIVEQCVRSSVQMKNRRRVGDTEQ